MPRPDLPITPAASTDITGQEKSHTPTELSFSLGPPAIGRGGRESNSNSSGASSSAASVKSDSSYNPNSPAPPPSRKRARPAMSQLDTSAATTAFSLPPPPSRSRKIIQMKPGTSHNKANSTSTAATPSSKAKGSSTAKSGANGNGTTATSKKTARKTAHSVIERRRRSKMNEEFDTMKEMIPACQGQSMHKLAILQAGIDYLRYLEKCVADLKAANSALPTGMMMRGMQSGAPTPRPQSPADSEDEEEDEDEQDEEEDEDEAERKVRRRAYERRLNQSYQNETAVDDDEDEDAAMDGIERTTTVNTPSTAAATSPAFTFINSSYPSTQPSPAFNGAGTSSSAISASHHTFSRSSTISSLPSPAFRPLSRPSDYTHSVESSPALLPNSSRDQEDREATAALLMLNSDRRPSLAGRKVGGGLSVQDLLSG